MARPRVVSIAEAARILHRHPSSITPIEREAAALPPSVRQALRKVAESENTASGSAVRLLSQYGFLDGRDYLTSHGEALAQALSGE